MRRFIAEDRGFASAFLMLYMLLVFGILFAGYATYHRLRFIKQDVQAAVDTAAQAAAEQLDACVERAASRGLDPAAACPGNGTIDPARASAAFNAALAQGLSPLQTAEVQVGQAQVDSFQVYQSGGGTTPVVGWHVPGPAVFAAVEVPVTVNLLGRNVSTFAMHVAALRNAPVWNADTASWGG